MGEAACVGVCSWFVCSSVGIGPTHLGPTPPPPAQTPLSHPCRHPIPVAELLDAMQVAQASGRPALLAASLRLSFGPIGLVAHQGWHSAPPGLFEAFCAALHSTAAALASGDAAACCGGGPDAAAACCPGDRDGMQVMEYAAMALLDALDIELALFLLIGGPWQQVPMEQMLTTLEALVGGAEACCPAAGCGAGCLHPLHALGAAMLRDLHRILDRHLDVLRPGLTSAQYARLACITCAALSTALEAGHNFFDGMLASPAAAEQLAASNTRLVTDVCYSCRHIGALVVTALVGVWASAMQQGSVPALKEPSLVAQCTLAS